MCDGVKYKQMLGRLKRGDPIVPALRILCNSKYGARGNNTQGLVDKLYVDLNLGDKFKPNSRTTHWWTKHTNELTFKSGRRTIHFYPHTLVLVEKESS